MDNKQQGAELNQLSRILFDKAAAFWQHSLLLELVAGIISVVISLVQPSIGVTTVWAILSVFVLSLSFYFKYRFEEIYDDAETMRRQSVLSEGLNWPISRSQFNEWKSRAGKKVLDKFSLQTRSLDYYETNQNFGPKRLAEMTFESAFWTKNLYKKVHSYLLLGFLAALVVFILLLSVNPLIPAENEGNVYLVYAVYLLIPILLSIDLVTLAIRIKRSIYTLAEIEKSLEVLAAELDPKIEEVMRLVAEYNCLVTSGIPIPGWVFSSHHSEIQSFWNKTKK